MTARLPFQIVYLTNASLLLPTYDHKSFLKPVPRFGSFLKYRKSCCQNQNFVKRKFLLLLLALVLASIYAPCCIYRLIDLNCAMDKVSNSTFFSLKVASLSTITPSSTSTTTNLGNFSEQLCIKLENTFKQSPLPSPFPYVRPCMFYHDPEKCHIKSPQEHFSRRIDFVENNSEILSLRWLCMVNLNKFKENLRELYASSEFNGINSLEIFEWQDWYEMYPIDPNLPAWKVIYEMERIQNLYVTSFYQEQENLEG